MKKFIYGAFALILAACTADLEDVKVSATATSSPKILNSATDCVKGSILVRFGEAAESRLAKCATRSGATRTGVEGVDAILDGVSGYAVEPVFVVTEKNREKVYAAGLHLWYVLRFAEDSDIESVAASLAEVGEVERVQFSEEVCRVGNPQADTLSQMQLSSTRVASTSLPFNDTYRKYQWSLNNLGSYSEVVAYNEDYPTDSKLAEPSYEADVNILPAWKLCKGDPSIVVAVVDEGVMYTHEDLAANMWVNSGEIPGDGVDNDGNKYTDDIYGIYCVNGTGNITWDHANDSGHGTHVAGIISAVNGNGKGICGIAGGDGKNGGAKIMSIQIFRGNGGAEVDRVAKGIQYAADNGAHILQCSWGHKSSPTNDAGYRSSKKLEADAINYFVKNGGDESGPLQGGLAIFAAGNEKESIPSYPAAFEPCVAVAAFNPALKPSYFTDYGEGTDVIAPGGEEFYTNGGILSTVPEMFSDPSIKNYVLMNGTSQACPHAWGVAALGLSYAKQLGKRYTAAEFRSMLLSATNDIEPYLEGELVASLYGININYSKYKGKLGAGYIDAYKLLLQVEGTPYVTVKAGANNEIDLTPYFGTGIGNAQLKEIVVSEEDKLAVGLGDCLYNDGKLTVNCSKSGVATFTVSMLVGGGSLSDSSKPYPTTVTKSFVVISKAVVSANGGWL